MRFIKIKLFKVLNSLQAQGGEPLRGVMIYLYPLCDVLLTYGKVFAVSGILIRPSRLRINFHLYSKFSHIVLVMRKTLEVRVKTNP